MSLGRPGVNYARSGIASRGQSWPRTEAFRSPRRPLLARMISRESPLRHMDWALTLAVTALSAIGVVVVWAATEPALHQQGLSTRTYLDKQALFVAIGLILMFVVSLIDYRQLRVYAPVVYVVAVLGLLAVLTPLGTTIQGSKGWIALPVFDIEPSEFAKVALILITAYLFSELSDKTRPPRLRVVAIVFACGLPVIALVAIQPALGFSVVLIAILAGMILLSGIRLRWVLCLVAVAAVAATSVFRLHLLKSFQLQRLTSFLHPGANAASSGYNALQAKIAVGSGGMFGQGLFHGQSVVGSYVPAPEQSTDFIFTVVGQELGFVGAIVVVALLGIVIIRALRIATRADDRFGMLVASGVAIWFLVQSFINVGMTIGITPITGIPLPFVSYGGSALAADMLAIGMLQSVHRRHSVFE
jgi:rod shape determining protein RodA